MGARRLALIDQSVADRCASTAEDRPDWPCRAGCDDCCRSLAELPELTEPEWARLRDAILAQGAEARERIAQAIARRRSAGATRPITCPLLDEEAGLCRVYEARPIACRTYGFFADREGVLGCHRIAALAERDDGIVWGNHDGVMHAQSELGARRSLLEWLDESGVLSGDAG